MCLRNENVVQREKARYRKRHGYGREEKYQTTFWGNRITVMPELKFSPFSE